MKLELSENVRRLRRERDLSQEQLAEALGVSVPSVSRWETGATYPDLEMLPILAGYFGVTTDELLGVSSALRKQRIEQYWADFEKADKENNVEEGIAILRRAYAEFPEEWLFGADLCEALGFSGDGHIDEVRRIVYDALERCTDTGCAHALSSGSARWKRTTGSKNFCENTLTTAHRRRPACSNSAIS